MATRWLSARRPCHRTSLSAQPAQVLPLRFDRKLVSRLHRLLRRLRDGKKLYAVVAQVGPRKPILKKDAGEPAGTDDPDFECPPPVWERTPMRVTFSARDDQKSVFSIRSRVVDVVNDAEEPEDKPQLVERRPSSPVHHNPHGDSRAENREIRKLRPQSPAASTAGSSSAAIRVETLALVTSPTEATMTALPIRM